jgi:predicted deacylase
MAVGLPEPVIEVLPKDLSPYKAGNTGIDYVYSFDSGVAGPHVVVNALMHGNELCGMTAVTRLLDLGVRPLRGKLTLSFANVAAYARFDPDDPFASRQIDRDLNRVWDPEILKSDTTSQEAARARELLPVFAEADGLLDIHSTSNPVHPMLCYTWLPKSRDLAAHIGYPLHHIVSSERLHQGPMLFEYDGFSDENRPQTAILVECGQHFARKSGDVALFTALRFIEFHHIVDPDFVAEHLPELDTGGQTTVYHSSEVVSAETDDFRYVRPLLGFEEFAAGDVIAWDGDREIRAPYGLCTVIMPRRQPVKGGEVVTLARRLT